MTLIRDKDNFRMGLSYLLVSPIIITKKICNYQIGKRSGCPLFFPSLQWIVNILSIRFICLFIISAAHQPSIYLTGVNHKWLGSR
jgi:hypothetical protein